MTNTGRRIVERELLRIGNAECLDIDCTYGFFAVRRSFRYPIVRNRLSAVDKISRSFFSFGKRQSPEVRTDVFPHDFALWRHLEKPAIRAFVD